MDCAPQARSGEDEGKAMKFLKILPALFILSAALTAKHAFPGAGKKDFAAAAPPVAAKGKDAKLVRKAKKESRAVSAKGKDAKPFRNRLSKKPAVSEGNTAARRRKLGKNRLSQSFRRKPAAAKKSRFVCREYHVEPHIPGYITLEPACDPNRSFCFSIIDYLRDFCKGRNLQQYFCDPQAEELHSLRSMPCPAGCAYRDHIAHCL